MIVSDTRADVRYIQNTSNHQKAIAVAKARGIPLENLDIGEAAPFDNWLRRFERVSACAGMYAADLRSQYFNRIRERLTEPNLVVDQAIADSDWWYQKFADVLYTLNTGEQPARRVLH